MSYFSEPEWQVKNFCLSLFWSHFDLYVMGETGYLSVREQEMVGYVQTNRSVKILYMKFENLDYEWLHISLKSSRQLFVCIDNAH